MIAHVRRVDAHAPSATLVILLAAVWIWALYDLTLSNQKREDRGDSQWRIASRHFKKSKVALTGLVILIVMYLVALLAPLLAPYDPIAQNDIVATSFMAPNAQHWLGTDRFVVAWPINERAPAHRRR